jgi:hypothetical protein
VDEHGAADRTAVTSFNLELALAFKEARPDLMVGAILGRRPKLDPSAEPLAALDLLALHHSLCETRLRLLTRARDQLLMVWTVDEPDAQRAFMDADVDLLVSNRPLTRRL